MLGIHSAVRRARAICYGLTLAFSIGSAQSAVAQAPPPEFEKVGVHPNRDYLRLQPFEHIDTQTGQLLLNIPMLSLPGNAGRSLDFQLTFNAHGWFFGIAGVPMRIDEQATPDPAPTNKRTIAETWGLTPKIIMADGTARRTMYLGDPVTTTRMSSTSDFWEYDRDDNKLFLPDGSVYSYASDGSPTELRLVQFVDAYGNTVDLDWQSNTLVVEQE